MNSAYLALIRHGESEWNAQGLWTGWQDIPLSDRGREEAKQAARLISDIHFDLAVTSALIRASETLEIIKNELGLQAIPTVPDAAFNERNYGIYTGKNKWQIKEQVGEDQFFKLRRGWDEPVQNGETLKDVYQRVTPKFEQVILPLLKNEKNVLFVAHGNSNRAVIKYLEHIADEKISEIEMVTGEVLLYTIDTEGNVVKKEERI